MGDFPRKTILKKGGGWRQAEGRKYVGGKIKFHRRREV